MEPATPTIIPERLAALPPLGKGAHDSPEKGMCALDRAGGPHRWLTRCAALAAQVPA